MSTIDAPTAVPVPESTDHHVKNVVLVEVTSCAFPDSVPDIVMTNILAKVPD